MNFNRPIILLAILYCLSNLCACSSEPTTSGECLEKYTRGVNNDKVEKLIELACNKVFDANETDDEYYKCLLKELPTAKTDKDVNIIVRRCTMEKNR